MNGIGTAERATHNRVLALFRDELRYRALGDWTDWPGNTNVEYGLLTAYLAKAGYTPDQNCSARAVERPTPFPGQECQVTTSRSAVKSFAPLEALVSNFPFGPTIRSPMYRHPRIAFHISQKKFFARAALWRVVVHPKVSLKSLPLDFTGQCINKNRVRHLIPRAEGSA